METLEQPAVFEVLGKSGPVFSICQFYGNVVECCRLLTTLCKRTSVFWKENKNAIGSCLCMAGIDACVLFEGSENDQIIDKIKICCSSELFKFLTVQINFSQTIHQYQETINIFLKNSEISYSLLRIFYFQTNLFINSHFIHPETQMKVKLYIILRFGSASDDPDKTPISGKTSKDFLYYLKSLKPATIKIKNTGGDGPQDFEYKCSDRTDDCDQVDFEVTDNGFHWGKVELKEIDQEEASADD
ncbi:unnamed protein product [Moneuplotes crassus]|uniref:Uncharacterized protein n=1 Tax=Euplotes crassus TaxID=5936 RepID=A0AAD2D4E3_EUPCR|nr:unnamed protein product [Moneuplotes crassus]